MKRFLAMMLALVLTLGLGTVALADGANDYKDMSTVTITKIYEAVNSDTESPAETFTFEIQRTSVTDAAEGVTETNMPLPEIGSVTYVDGEAGSATKSKDVTITLPEYDSVGIYTYTITENAGNTAGVTYRAEDIRLVVTVLQGENGEKIRYAVVHTEAPGSEKISSIQNTYSAGSLSISKEVAGNAYDETKYFEVTVRLNGETGKTYHTDLMEITGGSYAGNPETITMNADMTFYLKGDETITITNLPYGVTYSVVETDYTSDGYDEAKYAFSDKQKTIDTPLDTVTITNTKNVVVDTGIFLDSMPYILLLTIAAAGLFVFFGKRRFAHED